MSTLGEHQGNGIRFDMHLSAPNGGVAQMLCRPEGQWVSWNEYEKLKAEVERLTALVESNLNSSKVAMGKADAVLHERDSLKAEVERLRKAGDEMHRAIKVSDPILDWKIELWNAAKDGMPNV